MFYFNLVNFAAGNIAREGAVRYRIAQLDIVLHERLEAPQNVFLSEAEEDEWIILNDSTPARHASMAKVNPAHHCCICVVVFCVIFFWCGLLCFIFCCV